MAFNASFASSITSGLPVMYECFKQGFDKVLTHITQYTLLHKLIPVFPLLHSDQIQSRGLKILAATNETSRNDTDIEEEPAKMIKCDSNQYCSSLGPDACCVRVKYNITTV